MRKPELFMSVVVPAFNEENRLLGMLEEAVTYLEHAYGTLATQIAEDRKAATEDRSSTRQRKPNANSSSSSSSASSGWEILVVSDGSTDKTVETAFSFARDHQLSVHPKSHRGPWTAQAAEAVHIPPGTIRVITLKKNRGKGGAVTHGMRYVRGQYVVFADADGASKFDDLGKLVEACQRIEDSQSRAVAVGSRAHLVGSEAVVKVINLQLPVVLLGLKVCN
jgi:dolichyl-phosphate beta-glucosyltransferase